MEKVLQQVRKIHLVGIGGAGMSGLACLLQDRGFSVQGSDISLSSKLEKLQARGICVYLGHSQSNIGKDIDLVCYSSAISKDNCELQLAVKKGIRVIRRGTLLAYLCNSTKTIAIAGSHGKTTVVSLLSYLFKSLGHNPTVFIGGLPIDGSLPAVWGRDYSIIETDESDGTFLDYRPYLSVITNIDREHLNYYRTFASLQKAFLTFAKNSKDRVFGCIDSQEVAEIIRKTGGILFGFNRLGFYQAKNIEFKQGVTCFDLYKKEHFCIRLEVPLLGRHNCLNVLAALSVLDYLGFDLKRIKKYLVDFKGLERRFQIKGSFFDVTFVDDYAHHPTEIKAVLQAAKPFLKKRLVVVLQPHRPSRLQALFSEFSRCLTGADLVVVTDIYRAGELSLPEVCAENLAAVIKRQNKSQAIYINREELAVKVPALLRRGDLVLCLGAGDISQELEKIIDVFKKNKSREKF